MNKQSLITIIKAKKQGRALPRERSQIRAEFLSISHSGELNHISRVGLLTNQRVFE